MLVESLPFFTSPLEDKSCKEDENITFQCEVNQAEVTLTWFCNNEELKASYSEYDINVDGNVHSLAILHPHSTDHGSVIVAKVEEEKTEAKLTVICKHSTFIIYFYLNIISVISYPFLCIL